MENFLLGILILVRFYMAILKTAFGTLSRIELKQMSERYRNLPGILDDHTRSRLIFSFSSELSLLVLAAVWLTGMGQLLTGSLPMTILVLVCYLVVEKILITAIAFINREWIVTKFLTTFKPFYYLSVALVFPALIIAGGLIRMEDEREDGDEDREFEEKAFIDVATEEGIIEEDEKELIQGVLDFADTVVREIMTPRTDIIAVEQSVSYEELIELFQSSKHSRVPVYHETVDDIIGVVHLKDILGCTPGDFHITGFLQKPFYVPETKNVDELLREMQRVRTKMSVILDEYGGTAGIVTIEDLIEEIVGEIEDEHDAMHTEIQQVAPNVYLVDGGCNLETLCAETNVEISVEDIDTVGGAVFSIFGRIPAEGESEIDGPLKFTVEKMKRRRVQTVRIEKMTDNNVTHDSVGKQEEE